ncbi:MAG TPA: universal stress protein [Solirubrobacteraceae bacterium]|nr:universal stress protein [Solirubrobacteraceae bacterium]
MSATAQAEVEMAVGRLAEPGYARILLASEGRAITDAAIARVVELADRSGPVQPSVHVFSVARIHGVSFGFPNPGLMPTKREWSEQREIVAKAVKRLRRKGLEAEGHVLGTRKPTVRICDEAVKEECQAIVMAADPDRNRVIADMLWSQEPQRVRRRAKLPVFLVSEGD